MTRIISLVAALAVCLSSYGISLTPSSTYVRKPVKVGNVTGIVTNTFIDVEYTRAATQKVEIYGPDNIVEHVKLTYSGGTLGVGFKESSVSITGKMTLKVIVTAPAVNSFKTNSSGDITILNDLSTSGNLSFQTASSGDIKAKAVKCAELSASTRSSGDISFDNIRCTSFNANTSSSGDIETGTITASRSVRLKTMSSGDIETRAIITSELEVSTASSGDIKVPSANCSAISATTSSSGDIEIRGIAASTVSARSGSSGDINLAGDCTTASLTASSSGSIQAKNLKAETVTAICTSSVSSISCYAIERIDAKGPSRNKISISGNPRQTNLSTNR